MSDGGRVNLISKALAAFLLLAGANDDSIEGSPFFASEDRDGALAWPIAGLHCRHVCRSRRSLPLLGHGFGRLGLASVGNGVTGVLSGLAGINFWVLNVGAVASRSMPHRTRLLLWARVSGVYRLVLSALLGGLFK